MLLTEYAFYDKEDVEHYLTLLSDIDRYFEQILAFEKERSAAGLFMTDTCADEIISQAQPYLLSAEHNLMGTEFNAKIDAMEGLNAEEKKAFKEQNQQVVTEHFIPAYKALLEGLEALKGTGTNAEGICQFPDGKLYYQYLVDSSIGPTYQTMDDLQKAIEDQIDDSLSAMSQIMKQNPEINDELDQFHFSESDPEKILSLLKGAVSEDFPEVNGYEYVTKYVPKELEQSLNPAFSWFLLLMITRTAPFILTVEAVPERIPYSPHWRMKGFQAICIRTCIFCRTVMIRYEKSYLSWVTARAGPCTANITPIP